MNGASVSRPPGLRLAPLFVGLIGVSFFYSALSRGVDWGFWDGVLLTVMVLSGAYALATLGVARRRTLPLTSALLALIWAEELAGGEVLLLARHVTAVGFEVLLGSVLLAATGRATRVDADLVLGTASTYLLIGLAYAHLYFLLDRFAPGAFRGVDPRDPLAALTYYSFGSLTTLGSGDLAPVSPLARALTVGEAVFGNLFLAIIVARVVSMHVAHQDKAGPSPPRRRQGDGDRGEGDGRERPVRGDAEGQQQ